MAERMDTGLGRVPERLGDAMADALDGLDPGPRLLDVGRVVSVGPGVAHVRGLPRVRSMELLEFPGGGLGMAFNVDRGEVGVVLLRQPDALGAGTEARRTRRVLDVPVGEALLGRVLDALGGPQDGLGPVDAEERLPVERPAPDIMDRDPVTVPLMTGLKVVDALIPIGRGQRELILGDRQTGKTAVALDAVLNQKDTGVICIYCAVGKRASAVAKAVSALRSAGALDYTLVVAATEEDPPGLQFAAPYAATSMGEWFMARGLDVLVVYDDLTRHARAYRELSLLLRRPPGREAYPGDIFYVHSRLLERATHLRADVYDTERGGSLTALPIVETEAQNLSAYIPTNLISITDGQISLSPELFRKGVLPAVDVGTSVSRVGGKTQLPAYRAVAGDLRLSYSQFEELESFSRFGTRLDDETKAQLERGRRVREVLKQPENAPRTAAEQVAVLLAVNEGLLDGVDVDDMAGAEAAIRKAVHRDLEQVARRITDGETLTDEDRGAMRDAIAAALDIPRDGDADGDGAGQGNGD